MKSEIPPVTIYHDLIIKKDNDEFSQIDLVLVTSEGIIVFEVKDYSGWILEVETTRIGLKFFHMEKESISSTIQ